jgi:hypothetical protein
LKKSDGKKPRPRKFGEKINPNQQAMDSTIENEILII